MARKCYKASMLGPCNFLLDESDLAQHLLPCLVVALLHLLNDPSAESKTKEWCLNFVDGLIKTFEMHETEFSPSRTYFKYLNYLGYSKDATVTLFKQHWERVERAIPARLIADDGVLEQLRRCLVFFTTGEACNLQMQGLRLFNRLHSVLDNLLTDEQKVSAQLQVYGHMEMIYSFLF